MASAGSVKPLYFSYTTSASDFGPSPKTSKFADDKPSNPWVPFRVTLDEDVDPEAMLESLQVIFERRLSMANRIPEHDWIVEDAIAALTAYGRRNVQSHIEGSMEQFRYLPMAPTRMNKERVRIRK